MIGRTNAGGGGTGGVNFKVIGGTTAPTNPKENTIWVNTSVSVPSWSFSATEPENPVEGMVWVSVGTRSPAAFNVLKKNAVQVYPIAAKQYVDSAWMSVEAKSYQGGEWTMWSEWLYLDGEEFSETTGGWFLYTPDGHVSTGVSAAKGPTTFTFSVAGVPQSGNWPERGYCTNYPINFDGRSTLVVEAETTGTFSDYSHLRTFVQSGKGSTYISCGASSYHLLSADEQSFQAAIDVSDLAGSYYVALRVGDATNRSASYTVQIKEVRLD